MRKFIKRSSISLAIAVLLLALIEGGLRLAGYADVAAIYYDPDVGLRYYANQRRHMVTGKDLLGTMTINEWGFRAASFKREKAPGMCRVVCLGDSFTLGWGVDDASTYPRLLQDWFDHRLGAGRVEVLNCGLPDFNTVNEERLYRTVVREFHPDVVVLGYVLNDLQPETRGPVNMNSRLEHFVGTTAIMQVLRRHVWGRLGIYQYGDNSENRRLRAEFGKEKADILGDPDGEVGRRYWAVSMSALKEIATDVKQDGARLLLAVFPDRAQVEAVSNQADSTSESPPPPRSDDLREKRLSSGSPASIS